MTPRSLEQFEVMRTESREKILFAALELFAVDGYHNTSISKVAKHANVSKGLMYNYFTSKEELLEEVVTLSLAEGEELAHDIMDKLSTSSPEVILRMFLEQFFIMLKDNKMQWKLTFSLAMQVSSIPSIKDTITQVFEGVLVKLEMALKMAKHQNYKIETKLLAAQLDGISLHYILFEEDYDLELVKNELIKKYCQ